MQKSGGTEVTYEDQQRINSFNRTYQRAKELAAEMKVKQTLVDDLEDASNELMLVDEEEVRYVIGACFCHLDKDTAEEKLQAETDSAQSNLATLRKELGSLESSMADAKKVLYSKFGDSINLEE
ncbi:hypothetical protein WJX81_007003 [Elliptochloris bilobata]|uniref:Prefoldin subunit 4 n=1 Tax=Elliptochloris bilobata TaxID=381761 RepID=A0AAW1SIX6_9CHLO